MTVNMEKICGRATLYQNATPENPIHIKAGIVHVMQVVNPKIYEYIQQRIRAGAYIVEA